MIAPDPGRRDARTAPAIGIVLFAASLALAALPLFRTHLWGFNAASYLNAGTLAPALAIAIAAALLLHLGRPRGLAGYAVAAIALLALTLLFGDRTHLLGDGRLWLAAARERPAHHPHEPLAWALTRWAAGSGPVELRLEWWSRLLGFATLAMIWSLAGRIAGVGAASDDDTRWSRRAAFGLVAGAGTTLFAFGYIEAYPALTAATALLLIALLRWIDPEREAGRNTAAALFLGASFGLAVATHSLAVVFLPAVAAALLVRRPERTTLLLILVPIVVMIGVGWLIVPRLLGRSAEAAEAGRHWTRLISELNFHHAGPGAWLLEQWNRWGIAAGVAFPILLAALPTFVRRVRRDPLLLIVGLAALGLMLPALLLDTEGSRGAAADWDAFAVAGLPLALVASRLGLGPGGGGATIRDRTFRALIVVAIALDFFALLSFAAVQHDPKTASTRFEQLIAGSFRTSRARSWGWETLAAWRRDSGDMTGAADSYRHALAEQPENVRLLRNSAGAASRLDRHREAADLLGRLTIQAPADAGAWRHFGLELEACGSSDSAQVALRRSLTLDATSTDALNELARILLRTPPGRPEALRLIERSLSLAPDQPHAADLRTMRDRLVRDGYSSNPTNVMEPH